MNFELLAQHAYSPYSKKEPEWCVIVGSSGTAYPGVRVENISFPLTISAIHGAICSCIGNLDTPQAYISNSARPEMLNYWVEQYGMDQLKQLPEDVNPYDPVISNPSSAEKLLAQYTGKAVTPHSDFPVAAILQTEAGLVPGVNVELESWALGLCAERLAIFRAISNGFREFSTLKVSAPKGDFSSPCGACRQVLMEWMPRGTVELHHGDGSLSTHNTMHLLPYAFSSSKLRS
ncbi:MAG: cytidine deaminase [Balneolaceae bacterium]